MPPRAPHLLALLAALIAAAAAIPPAAFAISVPAGFVVETLPWAFDVPTKLAFLPDGALLVAEKGGIVYLVRDTTRTSLWVREQEVLNTDDRGLLSVAVDPDFASNRYLYFLYVCDPDSNGVELDNYADAFCRLTRYTVNALDPDRLDDSTRTVLVGTGWSDGFVSASGSHAIADLAFGADGTLLVSCGDGAHFEQVDAGGLDPGQFLPGRSDPAEDLGAFRSQSLASLSGKVLRLDPATGLGVPSNPFWDGNPASSRSRVWAYGLRNPFRIAVRPGTGSSDPAAGDPGTLYLGDVGWMTWEEVDVAPTGGLNFGWPCFEGPFAQPDYQAAAPPGAGCSTLGTPANPSPPTPPLVAVSRHDPAASLPPGRTGAVMVGGVFVAGDAYPQEYRGLYLYGDFGTSRIRALLTDPSDAILYAYDLVLDADAPVSLATHPLTGDVWWASIATGEIHRLRWVGGADAPAPRPAATLALSAPRPNPARGAMRFDFDLPAPAQVEFAVHDVTGRQVWRAAVLALPAGRASIAWDARDASGARVPPGVYLASVRAGSQHATRRVAVVR
jgi:glucose/arabinose dehydrogenase